MKRVLVTGARGFIGGRCLPRLVSAGYDVHAVTRGPVPESKKYMTWHQVDLFDTPAVFSLLREVSPSHLLHLAWITQPGQYWTSTQNLRWLAASLEMLYAFNEIRGSRVVAAGTCAEYDWKHGECSETTTPLVPESLYGACKLALSRLLEAFSAQTGVSSAWGRVFFPYGPGEPPAKLVSSVAKSLLAGQPASCSAGEQKRDFLHVEDVAGAFVALLESGVCGAVNIASGQATPVKQVVGTIGDLLGRRELVRLGELPSTTEAPVVVADIDRLVGEVGWHNSVSLESGLRDTIAFWQEQRQHAQTKKDPS